jgi:hypothetical protein
MYRAEGFREAKPCQRQRGCQHQDRQHGTTERAHGDADRPIAEAGLRPRPGNPKLCAGPLLPQRFGAFRCGLPQRCHTPRRNLLHLPALVAHGSVKLQQAGAAPSRGEEGRAGSGSPATGYRGPTPRRPQDDRGRGRLAEVRGDPRGAVVQAERAEPRGGSG